MSNRWFNKADATDYTICISRLAGRVKDKEDDSVRWDIQKGSILKGANIYDTAFVKINFCKYLHLIQLFTF